MKIETSELINISGGWSLTASFLSAINSTIGKVIEVGRMLGTALRRVASHNYCQLK